MFPLVLAPEESVLMYRKHMGKVDNPTGKEDRNRRIDTKSTHNVPPVNVLIWSTSETFSNTHS